MRRFVQIFAFVIQVVLGGLLIVVDLGWIQIGPLEGSEPLKAGMFTVAGAALVLGGIGGLVMPPSPWTSTPGSPYTIPSPKEQ